jgi:hypothetical protein
LFDIQALAIGNGTARANGVDGAHQARAAGGVARDASTHRQRGCRCLCPTAEVGAEVELDASDLIWQQVSGCVSGVGNTSGTVKLGAARTRAGPLARRAPPRRRPAGCTFVWQGNAGLIHQQCS